ncbi:NAD(P)H-binding protein [Paucilactobacillus sp. N302-9]
MTKNVLILGASGSIAKIVVQNLLPKVGNDISNLTLLVRNPQKLVQFDLSKPGVKVVQADVLDTDRLATIMTDQSLVYGNLYGADLGKQAVSVVKAMQQAQVHRLIWISANGVYDEIPGAYGRWNRDMLGSTLTAYTDATQVVEASQLDYTLIRPAWFQDVTEIDYEMTFKGEPFKGTEISRKSVADLVEKLIDDPEQLIGESVGVSKPNTDGPAPRWYR